MPTKKPALTRVKAGALLRAAEKTLMKTASLAAGYKNPEHFRRSLVESLHSSKDFHAAAHAIYGSHGPASSAGPVGRKGSSEIARKIVLGGRAQAARREPSHAGRRK